MVNSVCSGCVRKPVVRSSVPSFAAEVVNSQNTPSDDDRTPIMNNVNCDNAASELSYIQPLSDLQILSTSSHSGCDVESGSQPSQPAGESKLSYASDELSLCTMCASPQPSDCLNDIWLSSAAVDLASPIVPRNSRSYTALGLHEGTNMLT